MQKGGNGESGDDDDGDMMTGNVFRVFEFANKSTLASCILTYTPLFLVIIAYRHDKTNVEGKWMDLVQKCH